MAQYSIVFERIFVHSIPPFCSKPHLFSVIFDDFLNNLIVKSDTKTAIEIYSENNMHI